MKDKIETFLVLMIHFFIILIIGVGLGRFLVTREFTWDMSIDIGATIGLIVGYVYISFSDKKDKAK